MGCYPYASGPQLYSNDPISMEACAAGCTNTYASLYAFKYYYSYFNPDIQATDIRYVCECGNNLGYTPSDWTYGESCGQANFYDPPITTHPPGSSGAPSGWIRRQLKERLAREAGQKALAVCPKDMTACQTSSEDDSSFECLDVQSELESCGGCIYGSFGHGGNSSWGIYCLSLPGVSREGVTCLLGECLAFGCENGYDLRDNQCTLLLTDGDDCTHMPK
ncbi:hypothetical protein L486_07332 [Kwoniella mangroviensis CBS 10435]|uniref:Protein CPL1-like domain-containing protein n=1 Tax=Kwoniella mangroviensis CBS 10435 TaxID=1331196 RepID=A0A1B9IHQ1_9TREE|nr:hypothetical protein L486_07332 [Kwoniella mangroviensis CBS 10435]